MKTNEMEKKSLSTIRKTDHTVKSIYGVERRFIIVLAAGQQNQLPVTHCIYQKAGIRKII